LVATALGLADARSVGGRLDPRSAGPDGTRAVAALLGERGVDVQRTTDAGSATNGLDDRTVVLVAFPGLLPDGLRQALADAEQGTVVLLGPSAAVLEALTPDVRRASSAPVQTRAPGCSEPAAVQAGAADVGGALYTTTTGTTCYPGEGNDGALALGRTRGGARLVVLGSGETLSNGRLADQGNAALALTLLGGDGSADELRWVVPAPGTADDGGEGLSAILPRWVGPAALQLLLAGLLLALWRGRRFGPPVVEPLPVVVRAAEAVEGRARLYRRAQARDRAAEALRSGVLARLVPRLGVGAAWGDEPAPEAVVAAVASRSGGRDAEVHAALFGPPPTDDAGLVRLSETLDAMVRSTLDPEGPQS
jgi:hypothetical protein